MHQEKVKAESLSSSSDIGIEDARPEETPAYRTFLKSLIGREGVLWQGAFTGSGIAMEIRYSVPNWSTKKHHRLVRIAEVHRDFLLLDEHLPDAKAPHTRYMIPFGNLIISENMG